MCECVCVCMYVCLCVCVCACVCVYPGIELVNIRLLIGRHSLCDSDFRGRRFLLLTFVAACCRILVCCNVLQCVAVHV